MSRIRQITFEEASCMAPLFEGWQETTIWSFLQGCMGSGRILENSTGEVVLGQITVGDFTFMAGDVLKADREAAAELIGTRPAGFERTLLFMVPENESWNELIEEVYGEDCQKITRYAIKKEPGIFDREKLEKMARQLPAGYCVVPMDEALYETAKSQEWSKDFCAQYDTWEKYEKFGMGFMAVYSGELVGGVSSYSHYKEGIEIEIVTREDHRRKGLAAACAAHIILACMDRGLYASWDAATQISVALAEKLGYHFDREYTAYKIDTGRHFKMNCKK